MRAVFVSLPFGARRVLDFGCGTGWVISEAQSQGKPCRIGVDYSFEALQAGKRSNNGVNFVCSDGLKLPFADGSFDVVVGHVSIPYMETPLALREIHRVLAPGGSFFLTFHSLFGLKQRLRDSFRQKNWKDIVFAVYIGLNGLLNHYSMRQFKAPWSRYRFETINTPEGVYRTAREQGFILISVERCPERIFFAATARKPNLSSQGVLPVPGWSIYCPLAEELTATDPGSITSQPEAQAGAVLELSKKPAGRTAL